MLIVKGILYTLIVFTLLYLAFKNKNSAKLYNIIMLFCWIVIALSMKSYDISNYRMIYDAKISIGKDFFYDILQRASSHAGIHFSVFKVLLCTGIWILLYAGLQKYTKNRALAAALFILGPMIGFGTQLRSTIAGVIILNALPILLKEDGKAWKYCLWVAVASGFHMMAVFYFVFLIPKYFRMDSEKFRNLMCVFALILYLVFLVAAKPVANLLVAMQSVIPVDSINGILSRFVPYLNGDLSPNLTGLMYNSLAHLILFFAVDRMCVIMKRLPKIGRRQFFSAYALSYLHKLNSILLLIVPCYMLCMQFDRFHTYFVPVSYSLIAQGLWELRRANVKAPVYGILDIGLIKKLKILQSDKLRFLTAEKTGLLQPGNFEVALLLACMIFCFYVGNWHAPQGFLEIIGSIAQFGGTT